MAHQKPMPRYSWHGQLGFWFKLHLLLCFKCCYFGHMAHNCPNPVSILWCESDDIVDACPYLRGSISPQLLSLRGPWSSWSSNPQPNRTPFLSSTTTTTPPQRQTPPRLRRCNIDHSASHRHHFSLATITTTLITWPNSLQQVFSISTHWNQPHSITRHDCRNQITWSFTFRGRPSTDYGCSPLRCKHSLTLNSPITSMCHCTSSMVLSIPIPSHLCHLVMLQCDITTHWGDER